MGDVVSTERTARRTRHWTVWVTGGLLLGGLMASAQSAKPVPPGPTPNDTLASATPQTGTTRVEQAVEIQSLELREGSPGVFIDIEASGSVLWTSFRDAEGRLVVELPNSFAASSLSDLAPSYGLVSAVKVERETWLDQPITRLIVETRQAVEHSLAADGSHLELRLLPVEGPRGAQGSRTLSYEPVPEERPEEEPVELADVGAPAPDVRPMAAPAEPYNEEASQGTPDQPVVVAKVAGVPATRLEGVEVVTAGNGTVVRVAGDGEFTYSYFSLDNPDRFVIDLPGVVNHSKSAAVPVTSEMVDQVRVAQFKPFPEPVSRVVFDLRAGTVPRIEQTTEGLLVRFGSKSVASKTNGVAARPSAPALEAGPKGLPAEARIGEPPPRVEPPDTRATSGLDLPATSGYEAQEAAPYEEPAPAEASETTTSTTAPAASMQLAQLELDPQVQEPGVQEPMMEEEEVPEPPKVASPPASSEVDLFRNIEIEPEPKESEPGTLLDTYDENPRQTLGGTPDFVGEPIDMSVRDADLVEVLRMFAQISNLNIVVQPGVAGTVTVEFERVPWDQAMLQILRIHGLGYELEGNIMRIAPTGLLRSEAEERQRLAAARALSVPLRTIIKRLSYANAQQVAGLLQGRTGLLSQRGSVLVDRRTNTLIIKELPDFMDTVLAIIRNLDTPEPQVMIEARIVETTKRFTRSLGFEWGFTGVASQEFGNTTGLQFPATVDANGGVNLVTGDQFGFLGLTLGNVLNTFNLDLSLRAAETEGLINILSAPKVATLNNEQALIQSGLQIPIQTVSNNTVTVQFVNATLELRVTPQVTAEGTILMDIQIAKREPQLAFAIQGAANAPIATKEARTRVIVRDGGTTVIGGIYEVSTDQGQDRVPGLSNIPIIGHLFKNKRRNDENEELLIFITPRVINL